MRLRAQRLLRLLMKPVPQMAPANFLLACRTWGPAGDRRHERVAEAPEPKRAKLMPDAANAKSVRRFAHAPRPPALPVVNFAEVPGPLPSLQLSSGAQRRFPLAL